MKNSNWQVRLILTALIFAFCIEYTGPLVARVKVGNPSLLCQEEYKVGDQVNFQYGGNETQGKVIEINENGWLRVEFKNRGRNQTTLLSPNRVLGRAGIDSGEAAKPAVDNEFRIWTSNDGKTLEAKFVEMNGATVTLEKKDGSKLDVMITQLIPADMQVAALMASETAFGDDSNSSDSEDNGMFGEEEDFSNAAGFSPVMVEFDFKKTKSIEAKATKWELKADPQPPVADWDHKQMFSMDIKATHAGGVMIDPREPSRGFVRGDNIGDAPSGYLFDCKSGRTIGPFSVPSPESSLLAYDAIGHRLLTTTRGLGNNKTLDIWNLKSDGLEYQYSFSAYPPGQRVQLPASTGRFIDGNQLAILVFHKIGIYDLGNRKALYGFEFDSGTSPHFDATGKYVFGIKDKQLVAFDLANGVVAAKSPLALKEDSTGRSLPIRSFGVSPDLTKAAILRKRFFELYDLKTGQLLESFMVPSVREQDPVFLDNDNVLIVSNMGGSLVNIPLKSAIWRYSFCNFSFGPLGATEVWSTTRGSSASEENDFGKIRAFSSQIPNQNAKDVIQNLKLEDLIVLRPGESVALELADAGTGQTKISEQMKLHGFKIDPSSSNVLRATVGQGKSETVHYDDATGMSGGENVTFSSEYFALSLFRDGEEVWSIGGGSSSQAMGNFVFLDEGETVQSRANAGRITASQFFEAITVPELFVKIPKGGFYGSSRGTDTGFTNQ